MLKKKKKIGCTEDKRKEEFKKGRRIEGKDRRCGMSKASEHCISCKARGVGEVE